MCGRFAQSIPLGKLNKIDLYDEMTGTYSESYNVAPSQNALTLINENGKRNISLMKWGLIPHWTKHDKAVSGLINARFETITEKASFRTSYKNKRCIIPVTGFYEWQKVNKQKVPFFINSGRDSDGDFNPMLLCGLYDRWLSPDHGFIETFTVITTEASAEMKIIHDRMPLIIDIKDVKLWLGDNYSHSMHGEILQSFNRENLNIYPVSDYVNSYSNNSIQCIEPAGV